MENAIQKARSYLDAHRGERVTLEQLADAVGASPFHLQRRFKEAFGVSPRDYQDAHRVESVKSSLKNGSRVTDALFEAGYGSVSRFYEKQRLGMSARDYRAGGRGQRIEWCTFPSPLGTVLVAHAMQAAHAEGCRVFDFLRGPEPYKYRFGATDRDDTTWVRGRGPLARWVESRHTPDAEPERTQGAAGARPVRH